MARRIIYSAQLITKYKCLRLFHKTEGLQGSAEDSETCDETLWQPGINCHISTAFIPGGNKGPWLFQSPGICWWLNKRAENSHQPFRRREARFRDIKTLQKVDVAHASIHNYFNLERHRARREAFKQNRAAALAEWHHLSAKTRYHHASTETSLHWSESTLSGYEPDELPLVF